MSVQQEQRAKIRRLEKERDRLLKINDDLSKAGLKALSKIQTYEHANFWQRLKYLFGGKL